MTATPIGLDPDLDQVLRSLVERFDGVLALNASVVNPGRVREGDRVELLAASGAVAGSMP